MFGEMYEESQEVITRSGGATSTAGNAMTYEFHLQLIPSRRTPSTFDEAF